MNNRRADDDKSWIAKNISVGDIIAVAAAFVGIMGGYFSLKADVNAANTKTDTVEERHDRDAKRTEDSLREIKQMLIRLEDKIDSAARRQ